MGNIPRSPSFIQKSLSAIRFTGRKYFFTLWGFLLLINCLLFAINAFRNGTAILSPGPAYLVGGLGLAALIMGRTLDYLRAEREPPPIIIGLDVLVEHWKKYWLASDENRRTHDREIMYEQVRIIQQLFRGSKKVKLLKAFDGNKAEKGVFLIKKDDDPERVLKFDTLDNMRKERNSFRTYTSLLSQYTPGREIDHWPPEADWGLGDKRGAFVHERAQLSTGSNLQTFGQYYSLTPDVGNALDEIINILDTWWGDQKERLRPLFEEYKRLAEKAQKMEDGWRRTLSEHPEISGLPMDAANVRFSFNGISLPNPLHWVRSELFQATCDELDENARWDSIVHGDFHSGNILIEHRGSSIIVWLIDFPHTHIGPTVQDIARLEADIKFGLLSNRLLQNLSGIYRFEESLFSGNSNLVTLPPNSKPSDPELAKAWEAVNKLREKAQAYIAGDRAHYDLALLHSTMPALYYGDRRPWQKVYAFISAALLCHHLSLGIPESAPRNVNM